MEIMSCDRREIYCWMRPSRSLSWKGVLFFSEVNDESIPVLRLASDFRQKKLSEEEKMVWGADGVEIFVKRIVKEVSFYSAM